MEEELTTWKDDRVNLLHSIPGPESDPFETPKRLADAIQLTPAADLSVHNPTR